MMTSSSLWKNSEGKNGSAASGPLISEPASGAKYDQGEEAKKRLLLG
jgi:hypothetical protein